MHPHPAFRPLLTGLLMTVASATLTHAADPAASAPATPDRPAIEARHQRERAACEARPDTAEADRAACRRDADAARAQADRGDLAGTDDTELGIHRIERCEAHAGDARRDCLARMQGQGLTRGSAASGGIYRQLRRPEPATPVASAPR